MAAPEASETAVYSRYRMVRSSTVVRPRPAGQRPKGPVDPSLGRRVKALRESRGMTQAELAATDFSKGFISLLETGRTRVSLRAAEILARRLGVATADLVGAAGADHRQIELNAVRAEQEIAAGRPKLALDAVEASLPRAEGVLRARYLRLRGRALLELDRARESIAPLDESVRAFRTLQQSDQSTRSMFDLAKAHALLDAPGEALHVALEVERRIAAGELVDRTLELEVLDFVGRMFVRTGDHNSAALRADRALKLAEETSEPEALGRFYSGLSLARQEQGDFEGALTYARKSLALFEQLQHAWRVAETWANVGWLHLKRGQFGRADDALDRAERLADKSRHPSLKPTIGGIRAELELTRGRPARAEDLAAEAAAAPGAPDHARANALLVRAQAIAAGRAPLARMREAYGQAIEAADGQPRRWRAQLHESYARALKKRGQAVDAVAEYERALKLLAPALD